jgi:hypothetical protein
MRCEMKNTFYFLIGFIVLFNCIPALAQETEKTISLIPAIGDTLDKIERDYYKLFPNVIDFEFAVFYIAENKSVDANVCSKVNDKLEFIYIKTIWQDYKI